MVKMYCEERTIERLYRYWVINFLLGTLKTIVDFGCGTGTSSRRLANLFPGARNIIGFDLSPYMIGVGRFLMEESRGMPEGEWVEGCTGRPKGCAEIQGCS